MTGQGTLERRHLDFQVRAAGRRLEGYAATFGTEARISDFTEIIMPGAFRGALAPSRDVLALVDHDPTKVLARTRSGSLRLAEDPRGLSFSRLRKKRVFACPFPVAPSAQRPRRGPTGRVIGGFHRVPSL